MEFNNFKTWFTKLDEIGGATSAIYTGEKSPDWQWEGAPESMLKGKKCSTISKSKKSSRSKKRSTN